MAGWLEHLCKICPFSQRQGSNAPHAMQVALIIFLTVASLLVFAFFSYHLVLILSGMTSYESYKWTMLYKMRAVEQEAEQTAGAAAASGTADVPCKELRNLQDALAPPAWASQVWEGSRLKAKLCNASSKKDT